MSKCIRVCIAYEHLYMWIHTNIHIRLHVRTSQLCIPTQKRIRVPKCVLDLWNGPKRFKVGKALQAAGITPEQFDSGWSEKIQSATSSEHGKRQLVRLLEKAFYRGVYNDRASQLRRKISFVKDVVGNVIAPPPMILSSPKIRVCTVVLGWMGG